jgi:flagellar basal-body rod protein FlgG
MDASMWIAKTGLEAQQMRMATISNNLANVNTTGFKRDRAMFEDMLYQKVRTPGAQVGAAADAQSPTGLMVGTGVRIIATEKTHAQGNLITTKNALDLAIAGDGFFQITQPDGTVGYTRDGAFKLSSTGQITTSNGTLLQPAITVPNNASSISVGQDGTVRAELAGGGSQVLGQMQIARFVNPAGLQAVGGNLLKETPASGPPQVVAPGQAGGGLVMQGTLEASNVNVVEEMVGMIETQRAYEVNSKAIAAVDGMLRFLNNNL